MKTSRFIALVILFVAQFIFSQNSEKTLPSDGSSYVSVSPLSLADIYFPRLRVGYVQNLGGRWKIGADIGYGSKAMALDRNIGESYRLWEIRPEIYRVFNPNAKTIKYLSAEFFYIKQNNVFIDDNYDREDGQAIRYSRADYDRTKYGMHLKFGLFLDIGKNFGFNFYGGLGFRFKKTEFTNVINPVESDIIREWFTPPQFDEGQNYNLNPSLGFKFYYKI